LRKPRLEEELLTYVFRALFPIWGRQALQERIVSLQAFIQEEEEAETDSEDVDSEEVDETPSGASSDWGQEEEEAATAEEEEEAAAAEEEEEEVVMEEEAAREGEDTDGESVPHGDAEKLVGEAGEGAGAVEGGRGVGIEDAGEGGAGVAQEGADLAVSLANGRTNLSSPSDASHAALGILSTCDTGGDDSKAAESLGGRGSAHPRAHEAAGKQETASAHEQEMQAERAHTRMTSPSPLPSGSRAAQLGSPSPTQDRVQRRGLPLESPRLSADTGPVRPTAKVPLFGCFVRSPVHMSCAPRLVFILRAHAVVYAACTWVA